MTFPLMRPIFLSFKAKPMVLWLHEAKPKEGATVIATAGDKPASVVGSIGKGKVAVVLAAPLGDPPQGAAAFWDWSEWPKLMQGLIQTVMEK